MDGDGVGDKCDATPSCADAPAAQASRPKNVLVETLYNVTWFLQGATNTDEILRGFTVCTPFLP